MSKSFVNILVLTLTLAVTYANIFTGSFSINISSINRDNDTEQTQYYFESKTNLCFIQRTQETIQGVIENFYSLNYKKNQNLTSERIHAYEQKLISSSIIHFEFSSNIELSCSTKQLIYPFDYFW